MTTVRLVLQSLRFYWRSHLGVFLGATLATAILAGALAVGDSVRYSLREMALARLGSVHLALNSQSRFFRAALAERLQEDLRAPVAPAILLRGTAVGQPRQGEGARAGQVQVVGVDARFWQMAPQPHNSWKTDPDALIVNERLARQLNVRAGDEVLLRIEKPSLLSRDAPLATIEDARVPLRLKVAQVVDDRAFGRFSLNASQIPPLNAFVPLPTLQKTVGMEERANVLLVGAGAGRAPDVDRTTAALWKHWTLADSGLELRAVPARQSRGERLWELRTDRVFLDPPVAKAALSSVPGAQGVLTYFVNELRVGDRSTPYSTVAALQGAVVPPDMRPDEILINTWLAEDIRAKVGDTLTLRYWMVGPLRKLEEHSATFRIRGIVPIAGAAADPTLMPDIPGLSDKKDCRDWEPGVPIDLNRIRDKDQQYWDRYRGTPKAFLTLEAGQRIWNNRFGNLTAVRYAAEDDANARQKIEGCLRQGLNPAALGLFFTPVRDLALAASTQSTDFGLLFLGFSIFLIVSALLLTAMLFAFGTEQRAEEVGTLLALGFRTRQVQHLLLAEGAWIALLAAGIGACLAAVYTRLVIAGLTGVWSGAVAGSALQFHVEPATLGAGAGIGFLASLAAIWLVTRRQARLPARELLHAGKESSARLLERPASSKEGRLPGLPVAVTGIVGALILVAGALIGQQDRPAGYFFGAGALLLVGGLGACRLLMTLLARQSAPDRLTLTSLGVRNTTRRVGRSLGVIALLACGSFLVIAVGANRHDPNEGAERRISGTGGFALYAETALPVFQDLNSEDGQEAFGLDPEDMVQAQVVALRLREGDDASCLNLNRAQTPRLLGVDPEQLRARGAFRIARELPREPGDTTPLAWDRIRGLERDGSIPVIGDQNTVQWSLGKKLGDVLLYTDERGAVRRLKIVGTLTSSILQGSLILSEENFIAMFPSQSGYQVFLIDAPRERAAGLAATLGRALQDLGFEATPAPERLAMFNTVEHTYLSIFAALGGLGLLLGSVGLGIVVLRNVLERRSELAVLRAIGFRQEGLRRLLFTEHVLLLALGLLSGVVAAVLAVLPALRTPGAEVPVASLSLTLLAVLVSGLLWTLGATAVALRGSLLDALRND
ncbi:MAG: FtsX-like permease family protein [Chloroherpetonaceae bacterium]|nr:ABC transporter permease [Chthonomonadaceae bacterium]MDW8208491.1 FtsX-like permease family protein [Chloroherpetonaceae bacterium]